MSIHLNGRRMKNILILGATGTIAKNTYDIVRRYPELFKVKAMVARRDWKEMHKLAEEFKPEFIGFYDDEAASQFKEQSGAGAKVLSGKDAVISEICTAGYDVVVSAIPGFDALEPTLASIPHTKTLALANKESIVCAWPFIKEKANLHNTKIIPVDSEHSAVFQILENDNRAALEKITITASGGPFRGHTKEQLKSVTKAMALKHPNWVMGAKNTIDSATLANKGLEVIEACHFFDLQPSQIDALVHPQSVVHAMSHYQDGTVLWHLAHPDMRNPIAYAMNCMSRLDLPLPKLDASSFNSLTFEEPDHNAFPLLRAAKATLSAGLDSRIVFNAANEDAVTAFISDAIAFHAISDVVLKALDDMKSQAISNLDDVFAYDKEVRIAMSQLL